MYAATYNAPTYFPTSYFYEAKIPGDASSSTSSLPYNAPTYFPPSYFYGSHSALDEVPTVPTPAGLLPYNAPTYFPPSYFYGASSTPIVVPSGPDPQVLEADPYSVLLGLLKGTGLFEDVIFGASTQRSEAGADTYPLAVLTPKGWEESDDFDPILIVRRLTFSITIVVKGQDMLARFEQLDRLSTSVKKVVDRSDLDGTCLPALTRIRTGHYEYSNHYPEQTIDLEGEFSTLIDQSTDVPATS